MNRNLASAEPHLKVVARPSLYTTESTPTASDKSASILASLEAEPDKKVSRGWLLFISLVLLAGGLSYWAYLNSVFQQPLVMPAWMETALNISKAPIPVVQPSVAPVTEKIEPPAVVPAEETHPAIIVTESTPASATEPVAANPDTSVKAANLEIESTAKKAGEQRPEVASTTPVAPAASPKPAIIETSAHKTTAAVHVEPKSAEKTPHGKTSKHEVAKKGKDEDVDLIAALLTRVSHQEAAAKHAKHKKTAGSTSTNANTAVNKRQNKADPKRDIVTKADGDTTEDLLKRCKALGFFEGELCRIRICSSLWGKDPACPMPEQVALPTPNY
jgi:hypothetical protein